MLLCTLTFLNNNLDTVTRYVSNESLALTNHYWDAHIASLDPITWGLSSEYGGQARVDVGDFSLNPEVFDNQNGETRDTWPPPDVMSVLIEYSDTDDSLDDKIQLFEGAAHLQSIDRGFTSYDLYAQQPSFTVRSMKVEETLLSLFQKFVTLWSPNYELVSTYAASPSPDVDMTSPDSQMLFIDVLADICEYNGHFFYIDHTNSKVHLVDMNVSNGAIVNLTEFDFFPSRYTNPPPIRRIQVGDSFDIGDYAHGIEISMDNVSIPDAFLRAGDNLENDEVWISHNGNQNTSEIDTFIPYDKDRIYRLSIRYRKVAGTTNIYSGFTCMLDLDVFNNISGIDTYSSQHYTFLDSSAADNLWHNVTGYITGEATPGTSNSTSDGTTISGAITARTDTTYIRPLLIMNYNDVSGKTDIAYLAVDEVDSDGGVLENLYEYKGDYFNPDEWTFHVGSASLLESSAQDGIDAIKTIADKPTVELRLPLTNDNNYAMGQELTWIDESVHQPIDVTIKIRAMNFDFINDEVVIVGEGTLTEVT